MIIIGFKDLLKTITQLFIGTAVTDFVHETIEWTEKKVEQITHNVLKSLAIFFITFLGLIFVLVGIAKYLSEVYPSLNHGLGYVVIGAVLIIFALLSRLVK